MGFVGVFCVWFPQLRKKSLEVDSLRILIIIIKIKERDEEEESSKIRKC